MPLHTLLPLKTHSDVTFCAFSRRRIPPHARMGNVRARPLCSGIGRLHPPRFANRGDCLCNAARIAPCGTSGAAVQPNLWLWGTVFRCGVGARGSLAFVFMCGLRTSHVRGICAAREPTRCRARATPARFYELSSLGSTAACAKSAAFLLSSAPPPFPSAGFAPLCRRN